MKTKQRWHSLPQVLSGQAPIKIEARRDRTGIHDGRIIHTDYDETLLWFDTEWQEGAELYLIRLTNKDVYHFWVCGLNYYQNQSDRSQAVKLLTHVARKYYNAGQIGNLNTGWMLTDINHDIKSNGHKVLRTGTDVIIDSNNGKLYRVGAKLKRMFVKGYDQRAWDEIVKMYNRTFGEELKWDL